MKHTSLAAALAAALFSAPLPAAAEELEPIRIIQSTSSAAFMPYLTALTMGYFEEAGLEPELITTSSGSKVAAAVAGGSADVGMTAASTSLFLRNEGVDIRLLAPLATQYTTGIVFSEKWAADHGITRESPLENKLAALKGARLATPGGSAGEHILRYLAIKAGLDADREMVIVPMGSDIGTYQTALEQGQIDGISLSAPSPDLAVRNLNAVYAFNLPMGEVKELDGFLYTVAMTNGAWVDSNPEAAAKVVKAIEMATSAMHDDATSAQVRDKVRERYFDTIEPDLFADIWEQARVYAPKQMQIERADVEKVIEFTNLFSGDTQLDPGIIEGSYYTAP
ncbi:ABC transporter substrate-binding protein [Paracoccus sp. N5]|uniref:ABC transporter substrate-binding protein n=1 Tax=Paracoccus sp. N5 TaxID=1101189 RepID=UPI0003827F3A|nr:ABC transporter substrate-binding protein [Paracoccus sp. N5]